MTNNIYEFKEHSVVKHKKLGIEVLDRSYLIQSIIDDHLAGHIFIKENKRLKRMVNNVSDRLGNIYQYIGELIGED